MSSLARFDLVLECWFLRYFMVSSDGKVSSEQSGTFRSNCMDCLDRTNVIQSLLARRSLQSQLQVRDRITNSIIITRCDVIEDTYALEKSDFCGFVQDFSVSERNLLENWCVMSFLGSVIALLCSHDCLQTFRNQWYWSIMWLTIGLPLCVPPHLKLHVISEDGCPPCRSEDWGTGWFWEDL